MFDGPMGYLGHLI